MPKAQPSIIKTEYNIPDGVTCPAPKLTIALVADLHERPAGEILNILQAAQPDLVCIAGDTLERYGEGEDPRAEQRSRGLMALLYRLVCLASDFLRLVFDRGRDHNPGNAYDFLRGASELRSAHGAKTTVCMSLGNHEWYLTPEDRRVIAQTGTILLENRDITLHLNGTTLRVGGLSSKVDLHWLAAYSQKPGYKILLCHHPEYYERYLAQTDFDLILSGHAHGGQIRLHGQGLFAPDQGFLPKYHHGVYGSRLVVSAGCANTAALPRLGNPCEVVVLHTGTKRTAVF